MARVAHLLLIPVLVGSAVEADVIRIAMPLLANPIERAKLHARIRGEYDVAGTRADGKEYQATLSIEPDGSEFLFEWRFADNQIIKGTGHMNGDTVVVEWGANYPAIYQIQPDGVLKGTWDNGKATETLTPQR